MDLNAIFDGYSNGQRRNFLVNGQRFSWSVISGIEELEKPSNLPLELQYAFAIHPSRIAEFQKLLALGHGLAIGKIDTIGSDINRAVFNIASCYEGALHPWLEDLVINRSTPRWVEADLEKTTELGMDIVSETAKLTDFCSAACRLNVIKVPSKELARESVLLIDAIEKDIKDIHTLELYGKILSSYLLERVNLKFLLAFGLLIFAALIHAINYFFLPLGIFLAPLFPGFFIQITNLFKKHSTGAADWQILQNLKTIYPEIIFCCFAAFASAYFFVNGQILIAGILYAAASSGFFMGSELRRIKNSRNILNELMVSGKLQQSSKTTWIKLFYGPLWWSPFAAFALSVLLTISAVVFGRAYMANGWWLTVLSVSPWVIFWLLLASWRLSSGLRFKYRVKSLLAKSIIS